MFLGLFSLGVRFKIFGTKGRIAIIWKFRKLTAVISQIECNISAIKFMRAKYDYLETYFESWLKGKGYLAKTIV